MTCAQFYFFLYKTKSRKISHASREAFIGCIMVGLLLPNIHDLMYIILPIIFFFLQAISKTYHGGFSLLLDTKQDREIAYANRGF